MSVCTDVYGVLSPWIDIQDEANKHGKDHEVLTKDHRWSIDTSEKPKKEPTNAITVIAASFTKKTFEDDSKKYVSVSKVHLPNETCNQGWAAMINNSGQEGGPNKNIRVYYTFNNKEMVCDTRSLPKLPDPKQIYTLLGCLGGNYVIIRSEYIP
jgi:hypothetical protein